MTNHARRTFLRKTSVAAAGASVLSLTSRTAVADSDIPDTIEGDDGTGTVHIIRGSKSTDFHHPYLLYKPHTTPQAERPLFVSPGTLRDVSSPEEAIQTAISEPIHKIGWTTFWVAKNNQLPGLVPLFPTTPSDHPTSIQGLVLPSHRADKISDNYQLEDLATDGYSVESLKRIDKQFAAMIRDAKTRLSDEPYSVTEGIHGDGFSVSGDFLTRFALLYPHLVSTLTAGGGGFAPLPKPSLTVDDEEVELPYPLGTADYEQLTGREFDKEEWKSINQYIYVGEDDEPWKAGDEVAYQTPSGRDPELGVKVFGRERVTEMFSTLREKYNKEGASATFRIYENTGHRTTDKTRSGVMKFHKRNFVEDFNIVAISAQKSADRIAVGESVTVTVTAENRTSIEATTTVTLATGKAEAETTEIRTPPRASETIELETTFDEAGEYTLKVNEETVGNPVTVTERKAGSDTEESPANETTSPEEPNPQPQGTTAEDQPGFGVLESITALGGVGYLIKQRISADD